MFLELPVNNFPQGEGKKEGTAAKTVIQIPKNRPTLGPKVQKQQRVGKKSQFD